MKRAAWMLALLLVSSIARAEAAPDASDCVGEWNACGMAAADYYNSCITSTPDLPDLCLKIYNDKIALCTNASNDCLLNQCKYVYCNGLYQALVDQCGIDPICLIAAVGSLLSCRAGCYLGQ
jgi:hypothetical protein